MSKPFNYSCWWWKSIKPKCTSQQCRTENNHEISSISQSSCPPRYQQILFHTTSCMSIPLSDLCNHLDIRSWSKSLRSLPTASHPECLHHAFQTKDCSSFAVIHLVSRPVSSTAVLIRSGPQKQHTSLTSSHQVSWLAGYQNTLRQQFLSVFVFCLCPLHLFANRHSYL